MGAIGGGAIGIATGRETGLTSRTKERLGYAGSNGSAPGVGSLLSQPVATPLGDADLAVQVPATSSSANWCSSRQYAAIPSHCCSIDAANFSEGCGRCQQSDTRFWRTIRRAWHNVRRCPAGESLTMHLADAYSHARLSSAPLSI